ncbi:unnamed protein product [Linum trigynum]|uniref:Uncharacterized protein n=1 Tax=Linum trigynum TaxID=586398 RepID=A0AAV2E6N0_9ROSI
MLATSAVVLAIRLPIDQRRPRRSSSSVVLAICRRSSIHLSSFAVGSQVRVVWDSREGKGKVGLYVRIVD